MELELEEIAKKLEDLGIGVESVSANVIVYADRIKYFSTASGLGKK
ncbi:MAG: hypothetical protein ABIH76_07990 [Candidatus Bathyarchaeota archaeon]